MKPVLILGAGKYSSVMLSYLKRIEPDTLFYRASVNDEPVIKNADAECIFNEIDLYRQRDSISQHYRFVLGLSGIEIRKRVLSEIVHDSWQFPNFISPLAITNDVKMIGHGNVIAENAYLGVDVTLGSFNTINYHCCIGNHTTIDTNNFFSPMFNCGNSTRIDSDCLFGLSVVLAPATEINSGVSVSPGTSVSDGIPERTHCFSSARQKIMRLNEV